MADLFVSYSREDKARAEEVVRLLEDYGWDVFWDQETRSGTHWPKVLEEELIKARCLVALWTTTSIASRWVRIEAYEALQNEKLVPVLLDKVRPPLEFRQTQTFDLTGWNGDRQDARLAHLLVDLTALAKAPGSKGGTSRPIKLVVPPTLQREKPATLDSPPPRDHDAAVSSWGALSTLASSRGAMLGLGVAVVVAATWLIINGVNSSPKPAEPTKAVVVTPSEPSTTVATPLPPAADPQPAKATTVATGVPPVPEVSKSGPKPTPPKRSSRCLAIDEKFQQTGQITKTEQEFLRSKECQS